MGQSSNKIACLIMAGGLGSRLNKKKMLLDFFGSSIIEREISLIRSISDSIYICISENTEFLLNLFNLNYIQGSGDYSGDLLLSLKRIDRFPLLVMPADIIFNIELIVKFISMNNNNYDIINMKIKNNFTGVSIFNRMAFEKYLDINMDDPGFFNVNTMDDYKKALEYYKYL
ncbi:NTP transferase domain-containing protein [Picrophilus oshimae]|uniref:MobA-like NTP transferase domain-containing protein n=1 Tax=Picrophilus torridus (strain ATCC 700027 / DSM 9790 / JCM 10055 / NBRC 100828 / KAW 2/3) TaxID=1122961 RepID=Q6KZ22_PICTO|nr:NTP transferase domain-containing protein [Picrophilus oshimae]AAT44030.1 hypothetical protein PTO1445 [Picrophilus oshimae DSM 9789]